MRILLAALLFDLVLGEPPAALHPVVWMGKFHAYLRRRAPTRSGPAFAWGLLMTVAGPLLFGGASWWLLVSLGATLGGTVHWLLAVYLLKSAFSVRGLAVAGLQVQHALRRGDLPGARQALRSLVSRDTSTLPPTLLAAAAIESVAENCSDSIVAPLFFYAVGGVPAALAYRAINTLDSMIGYRGELEWLGKAAARFDDLVNILPARLTALLLAFSARLGAGSTKRALAIWARDRRCTESPNAGHPMAAMAGALGIELEKVGHYCLGRGQRAPEARDIGRAVRVMAGATALACGLALLGSGHET